MGVIHVTDPVDDLIRDRMRDSYRLDHTSDVVLEGLRPRMARARTRRKALQASAGAVGAGALLLGGLMIASQLADDSSELHLAGGVEVGSDIEDSNSKALSSPSSTDELGRLVENPEDNSALAPTTSDPQDATATEPPTTIDSEESGTTTSPNTTVEPATSVEGATTGPATTVEPSTTAAPTTTVEPSTTAAPTTTEAPSSTTINTACGSLEVELVGSGIELVSTEEHNGVDVEVSNSGPEKVEVSFEGGGSHCEVIAENRNGEVWSDVSEEDE